MWAFVTPSRHRRKAGHNSASPSRLYRPHCNPLESRCLLTVSLSGSQPAVPLVGSPVVWTAVADGHGATPVYQFSVGPVGRPTQVVRDFSPSNSFQWDPLQEGNYAIQVTVKDSFFDSTGETTTASYTANSRVVGSQAVISPTSNPLVALYSAPPSAGRSMYVQFEPLGANEAWTSTSTLPIVPGQSTNFLVAGMHPNSTYVMRHVLDDGTTSDPLTFTTGSLPTNLTFPTYSVQQAPSSSSDLAANVVLHVGLNAPEGTVNTLATDRMGNVIWYYDQVANDFPGYAPSLVPGGTLYVLGGKNDGRGGTDRLREIDLAGDTLRETSIYAVNAELAALGQGSIINFSHDVERLPNGDTAVLAGTNRTVNFNGTPTEYTGDMVLVLDRNFQVVWVWDPFQWLDTNILPTLGEGAIDWTHANSIGWSPADGNLVVSMRSQDMAVKIDYSDGAGDGHVIWRLGNGGDFVAKSSDPSPWFSHQHDVSYVNNTTLMVFDNGNTRHNTDPQATSRGQEWVLNEKTMQATLVANIDLGSYSFFMGSAQMLPNGNFVFGSVDNQQTIETLPDGTKSYVLQDNTLKFQYRAYIFSSLYGDSSTLVDPFTVDLTSAFNRTGIVTDGAVSGAGLDGHGNALPFQQVGSSLLDGNARFFFGPVGVPNVVSAAGQVIALPAGKYNALKMLATGVDGAQKNQLFRVTYADGTTRTFRRSLSDWTSSKRFPGESTGLTTSYLNVSGQAPQPGRSHVYMYTLKLNPRKTVSSLTLPVNANVEVVAATLIPANGPGSENQVSSDSARRHQLPAAVHAHHQAHPVVHPHHGRPSAPSASLALRLHNRRLG